MNAFDGYLLEWRQSFCRGTTSLDSTAMLVYDGASPSCGCDHRNVFRLRLLYPGDNADEGTINRLIASVLIWACVCLAGYWAMFVKRFRGSIRKRNELTNSRSVLAADMPVSTLACCSPSEVPSKVFPQVVQPYSPVKYPPAVFTNFKVLWGHEALPSFSHAACNACACLRSM